MRNIRVLTPTLTFVHEVEDAARSGDHNVDWLVESHDVVLQVGSTGCDHDV